MEEGSVDGDLEEGALRLALDGLGVGSAPVPEVVHVVPLLARAAVDEVRGGVEGCEATGVKPRNGRLGNQVSGFF